MSPEKPDKTKLYDVRYDNNGSTEAPITELNKGLALRMSVRQSPKPGTTKQYDTRYDANGPSEAPITELKRLPFPWLDTGHVQHANQQPERKARRVTILGTDDNLYIIESNLYNNLNLIIYLKNNILQIIISR